ncbi:MAG: flagellar hook-basal body complex protein FliE [Alphaproteobacteria bacterium]|nr:flagellar hook-basal body complex protein FliE [Alphaproteobacteria bacterium]
MAITPPSLAAAAYQGAARIARTGAAPDGAEDPAAAGSADFGTVLAQAAQNTMQSLKAGEKASLQAIAGKADVGQVVQALSAAETTLQAAVAVRDRVVAAYQEIIRMPI